MHGLKLKKKQSFNIAAIKSGEIYQNYFINMGMIVLIFGVFFTLFAWLITKYLTARNIEVA
ncbi:hypothetical protein [Fangia hongkongensis]|uniref:hypothetical protein n=1 Tax=Fangia hongkongensis TaxID=270495 RepID=UPI00037731E4|nr:hypothetical protein [Fangia hongkongensis]